MTEAAPQPVRDYLSQLESALADVQLEVKEEIMAGIREELDGLDAAAAMSRIDTLGDPIFIAAEAKAAMPVAEQVAPPPGRTFSLVAALVLIIGTFVIPLVGPIVGLLLVSFSTAWSRREKIVAWLVPVAAALIVVTVPALVEMDRQKNSSEAIGPVLSFVGLTGWHLGIVVAYFVLPLVGVLLLVRASRRGWKR